MFHVFHSNHVERLVDALAENIRQLREMGGSASVFEPIHVVIPNWNLETYLKFEISSRLGISANFKFQKLEDFLISAVPAEERAQVKVLSRQAVHHLLVEVLSDDVFLARPELAAVQAYLLATGDAADAVDMRRFQLAGQLGRLFREYSLSRRAMLEAWPRACVVEREAFVDTERWQRLIWLELFGPEGRLARLEAETGIRYVRITQLFERNAAGKLPRLELPDYVHVFGLSYVAKAYEHIFEILKGREDSQLVVYTLNPCGEFWEDLRTGLDDEEDEIYASSHPDAGGLLRPETDNPALRLWGRPGRDNDRMLNRLSEHTYEGRLFRDPVVAAQSGEQVALLGFERPTLLHQLQRDILARHPQRPRAPEGARFDDESIMFLACPSVQREVEVLANEIWALIEDEEAPVRFNEIAVVVNNSQKEAYQTHIRSVFKDVHDIPHNVVDVASASRSRVFEAMGLLLALPFGEFKRADLLRFVTHPNVMAKFPGVEAEQWLTWCHELHIVHGGDHEDHLDTYIESDLLNWNQGMRRLVLGAFMADDRSGEERAFILGKQAYLPYEYSHAELSASASLALLVRSLVQDVRFCRTARLPLAQWIEVMTELVRAYMSASVSTGLNTDTHDLMSCQAALAEIAEIDHGGQPVSYRVAYEFAKEALAAQEIQNDQYLINGVVVSSFLPMRPIPFKVVFVTGMGEGKFPVADKNNPLDLRLAGWQEGDVKSREQDKYMFLETLVSTRQRLYLSWVSRDNRTGEPLEPSSVVKELQYMLHGLESRANVARRVIEHPLRRHDALYFPAYFGKDGESEFRAPNFQPEAQREAQLKALREDLRRHCFEDDDQNVEIPELEVLERRLPESVWRDLSAMLKFYPIPDADSAPDDEVRKVSLSFWQIRRFLECPLQASAGLAVGLRTDEEEDLFAIEDEVFETGSWPRTLLLRDVFLRKMGARDRALAGETRPLDLAELYADRARYLELRGVLPTGLFHEAEKQRHIEVLQTWTANLAAFGLDEGAPLKIKRFGRAEEHIVVDEILDSITLEIKGDRGPIKVEIFGETQAMAPGGGLSMSLLVRDGSRVRDFLPGFLDHVFLAASGNLDTQKDHRIVVNATKPLKPKSSMTQYVQQIRAFSQAEARAYLGDIVGDMLSGVHDYLLPVEAVMLFADRENKQPLRYLVDSLLSTQGACSSQYGPVRRPESFKTPPENKAWEIIGRRFGPYLSRLGGR